ncbi:hypothetical protein BKA62DRAFT_192942 [Auriculariales sp. MPI-PUGE-AT-0066]|nr:hypothetical protein BKA62DRAFT_192942 [Auriculariales sp. MPI-PUGE-AT-0066]
MSTPTTIIEQLRSIQSAIPDFVSKAKRPQLPILDDSLDGANDNDKEPIQGIAHFKDKVQSEIDYVQKFSGRTTTNDLSTNAPNLGAVWNEILAAPPPVLCVGKSFNTGNISVRVDAVADDGRQWIRVNTMKNSRLMVEFREQDSYLTDSDSDADEEQLKARALKSPLRNSILEMATQLLAAAAENPMSGAAPTVVLRLTRLSGDTASDPRVARTIEALRAMPGLVVELGERNTDFTISSAEHSQTAQTQLLPTQDINLDLSLLVALVSDSTHAPLPASSGEAMERFRITRRPQARRVPMRTNGIPASDEDAPSAVHLNALANQVVQEMHASIIEQMAQRSSSNTRFWTTAHARDRCIRIVERIGGPSERARAEAWLLNKDIDGFWANSRYQNLASSLPLVPLCIFPDSSQNSAVFAASSAGDSASSDFYTQTLVTCDLILSRSGIAAPEIKATETAQKTGVGRLTVHTVQSLAAGATARMTTLTANRASVRAFLREMRSAGLVPAAVRADSKAAEACLWILDPRSLSEGMRADRVDATASAAMDDGRRDDYDDRS